MIKLSASTLNIFLDCPRCFWLTINKDIRRPRGPMPSITIGMDSIIKRYFDVFRKRGVLPHFLEGKISGRLIEDLPKALYYKPAKRDALLWGKLDDCVVSQEGYYAALDHKTKGSSPQDIHSAFKFQMDTYTLLLLENGRKVNNTAYLVYYFPSEPLTDNGFDFAVEVRRVDTDPRYAREVFFKALKILEGPLPAGSSNCRYCNYIDSLRPYT